MDYLFFDLDGTLTDPKEGITKCVDYALKHFGIHTQNLETLTKFIGPPLLDSFMEFYGFDAPKAKLAIEKFGERFSATGIFENRVYPGVLSMLQHLCDAGKTLALASSKPWVFSERILEKYGLSPYFSVVSGSELDGRRNAKAEVIAEAFKRLQLSEKDRSRCIMVGDRKHDIIGAKANHIASLGVRFGYAQDGELEAAGADYITNTIEQTEALLLTL